LRYFRSVLNLSMVLVIKFMHQLKQFSFPINESTYILYLLLKYFIFYILINIKIRICTNYNIYKDILLYMILIINSQYVYNIYYERNETL
jgi:hypothetical protein